MNTFQKTLQVLLVAFSIFALSACANYNGAEGVGKSIDEMANDAGNAIEDACEGVKEGLEAEDSDC